MVTKADNRERVLVALDAVGTIANSRGSVRLVADLLGSASATAYRTAWQRQLDLTPEFKNPGSGYRAAKTRFVNQWVAEGRGGVALRQWEIEGFASQGNELYPGVVDTLRNVRQRARRFGVDVVFVVITNSWADIYRSTELCNGDKPLMTRDHIFGQELHYDPVDLSLVGPREPMVSSALKPVELALARERFGIAPGHVVVGADGYTDEDMFIENKRLGGRNFAIVHSLFAADDKHATRDFVRAHRYRDEGKVDRLVEAFWNRGSVADAITNEIRALMGLNLLAERPLPRLSSAS